MHTPNDPHVAFAYFKWMGTDGQRDEAFSRLKVFVDNFGESDSALRARYFHRLGQWANDMCEQLDENAIRENLNFFRSATIYDPQWSKAWHSWALMNNSAVTYYQDAKKTPQLKMHIVPAVHGFFRSIALKQTLQDILRLLTLLFKYGADTDVEVALIEGFNTISIDTWLNVIPQIIARIDTPSLPIRLLIHQLLVRVGKEHPQATY